MLTRVAKVWEEKIQGLLKDFQLIFPDYSCDVLPSYEDNFREYLMFLASCKNH